MDTIAPPPPPPTHTARRRCALFFLQKLRFLFMSPKWTRVPESPGSATHWSLSKHRKYVIQTLQAPCQEGVAGPCFWRDSPPPPRASSFTIFLDHNDAPQSVGLFYTSDQLVAETSTWQHAQNTTDKRPCLPVGFEPTISAGDRPQTYALDRVATGTGSKDHLVRTNP